MGLNLEFRSCLPSCPSIGNYFWEKRGKRESRLKEKEGRISNVTFFKGVPDWFVS